MEEINLFLGGGAARGIWQVGFLTSLVEEKIKTNQYKIKNIYALSAGNFAGLGLLFGEHELLAHYWNSYDEKNFPMFHKTNKLVPYFTWEDSPSQLFTRTFLTIIEKKNIQSKCNFYSGVFNINKLEVEWLSCHDKTSLEIEQNFFASCTIPVLYPVKKINNNYLIDAGLLELNIIKDILNKHSNEKNIILTTFDYCFKNTEKNLFFPMPNQIKEKVNFIENNQNKINLSYNLSLEHGKKLLEKI
jgi:predicted acylesterase/phospholipase RssA